VKKFRAKGLKPDGSLTKIRIKRPPINEFEEASINHVVTFKDGAITISGNLESILFLG
jgi:thiamine biosynthesis lipoprotein ApbE